MVEYWFCVMCNKQFKTTELWKIWMGEDYDPIINGICDKCSQEIKKPDFKVENYEIRSKRNS
jgi:hypothetical protein